MLFNTSLFVLYFTVFFLFYTFVARTRRHKLGLIVVGSCIFYAGWDFRFVPLLLGTALLDFFIARAMSQAARDDRSRRRRLLVFSIALNVGVLVYFKYTNFFLASAFGLLHLFGVSLPTPFFKIALPVGISFYTFQSMSYTIDVYRGTLAPREHPLDFLAGVTFFPHLVAGPIIRASVLLPQFETFAPLSVDAYRRGVMLIAFGLFNKAVADLLGQVVDAMHASPANPSMLAAWTGVLAFAGQLYGDFCGYTDIAIGAALLLGFELPKNFDLPYLSTSPVDIWARWHISLSTWLRDYLYMPLMKRDYLANKPSRPYRNMFITMLVAGIWHGAGWTFVLFGVFWGAALAFTHYLFDKFPKLRKRITRGGVRVLATVVTFYCWLVGGVLFRSADVATIGRVLRAMHAPVEVGRLTWAASATLVLVLAGLVAGHLVSWVANYRPRFQRSPVFWPVLAGAVTFSLMFGGTTTTFIYFQF